MKNKQTKERESERARERESESAREICPGLPNTDRRMDRGSMKRG